MDWQLSVIIPAVVPLFVTLIRTPEDQRDPAAIARLREAAAAPFRLLEAALDRNPYLEGEALTLADIGAGIWTHRWFGLGYGDPDGNLGAWYRRLGERAGYRQHVMIPLT
jgi:glutathione S-transferase